MRLATLQHRSLLHFWRTHVAVVLGVATAVAVLAGSLLVGESVRESLARLALSRLGRASFVVQSPRPFREGLAVDLAARAAPATATPLLATTGVVTAESGGRLAADVLVYGVDQRFFAFHGAPSPASFAGRSVYLSEALARELQSKDGDSLLVKLPPAAEIPGSTLFGRRDEPGRRLRAALRGVVPRSSVGDFALRPGQQDVRAVFVPLPTLQRALGLDGQANTILVGEGVDASRLGEGLAQASSLEDLGLRLKAVPGGDALVLESASALLDDAAVVAAREAAAAQGLEALPALIYLANAIRANGREVPYSLVAGLEEGGMDLLPQAGGAAPLVRPAAPVPDTLILNEWTAAELQARPGDRVTLEYYLWREEGRLETASASFTLARAVPLAGLAADRHLVPEYPGITQSLHLSDWDPPFPVDLKRIRPRDEAYWDRWRTTPKAFLPLGSAQQLWGHRLGRVTSLRLVPPAGADLGAARERFEAALRSALTRDPGALRGRGIAVLPVREGALRAARGTTDFGEYFLYFSFFLVVAALLLAALFFRLGLEQRLREVGLLRALGFAPRRLAAQFAGEGLLLTGLGSALGVAAAPLYAGAILYALRTVWWGAVGTRDLALHVGALPLAIGLVGGVLAALLAVLFTVRRLVRRSPRALLAGALDDRVLPRGTARRFWPPALALLAATLLAAASRGLVPAPAAFFATGALLLASALLWTRARLTPRPGTASLLSSVPALGRRGASFRPGRSLLCIALVAGASFVIVSVGAFRRSGGEDVRARDGEAGGYPLLASSLQPLHNDPETPAGRAALGLPEDGVLKDVGVARFRRSAGEDGSCLNLYRPSRPTVLGATPRFLREGRFSFQSSLAATPEEHANPWLLLEREEASGVLPVAADANSLAYVFHKKVGDLMPLGDTGLRVRFVAALRPGLFQSELLTGERHFQRAFTGEEGYRFFLLDPPPGGEAVVTEAFESRLSDYGFDVGATGERLATFHRVENTYISTFQSLGALGLLLGTLGLGTVLLRNALERRRELALLRAVGFGRRDVRRMVLSENALLLGLGLAYGAGAALLAILPALAERGGGASLVTLAVLVLAVSVTGILVSWLAVAVIARLPLLASLRSE